MNDLWDIWKSYYMTYAEIAICGDKPRELIKRKLSFDKAKELVKSLGFEYSLHPSIS